MRSRSLIDFLPDLKEPGTPAREHPSLFGRIANRELLTTALEGQDIAYHFICATTPIESWNDPYIENRKSKDLPSAL